MNFGKLISAALFVTLVSACTFSGGTKQNGSAAVFISGAVEVDKVQNVHIVNMIRAIGAPNNSTAVGGYKYYLWQHSRTVGVNTLFGGGSTTLYCNLTTETQANKIKLINWYGNQCSIFIDPMKEYFSNKLNIEVIIDETEKKQSEAVMKNADLEKESAENNNKPVIDLRQKSTEQKAIEQNVAEPAAHDVKENNAPILEQKK